MMIDSLPGWTAGKNVECEPTPAGTLNRAISIINFPEEMNWSTRTVLVVAAGVLGLSLVGWQQPWTFFTHAPMTQVAPAPPPDNGRELNLLWHYERELRVGVCRGDVAAAFTLVDDIGYDYVEAAMRAYISPQGSDGAVRVLASALHLSPAEQEAWKIMLSELCRYEFSPSWQKAGVPP
jgi:hypothetical protein